MRREHGFEIRRVNVETPGDDHVFLPVQEIEKAVVVEAAEVAGAKVELTPRVEKKKRLGFFVSVQVAAHHAGGASDDLTGLAGRGVAALFVDDSQIGAG